MDLLVDNDAMVKLGQCRMLEDFRRIFGEDACVRATETFEPWFRRQLDRQRIRSYVRVEIETVSPKLVELHQSQVPLVAKLESPGIDAGEAVLIAAAHNRESVLVCTGDKKALRALARHPATAELASGLRGKLLCVEQAFLLVIDRYGFEGVRDRIVRALAENTSVDSALRSAFGSADDATEGNVRSALHSYVRELHDVLGDLLWLGTPP